MLFLSSILVLLIAYALWHWKFKASDYPLPGGASFPTTSVAILSILLGLLVWSQVQHRRLESRLAEVATELAGRPAPVNCESFLEAWMPKRVWTMGYVSAELTQVFLRHGVCGRLREVMDAPDPQSPFHSTAVVVLAHEAMHVHGITNEAQTECAAMQRAAKTAMLLGVAEPVAHELARAFWRVQYRQIRQANDDAYYSAECRPNGALDEGLPYAPWDLGPSGD